MPHDTKLKSMRISKSARKEDVPVDTADNLPAFPYGLRLQLNNDSISKLGMKSLPRVGSKMVVSAVAEVIEVSEREERDRSMERSVELQVQELQIKPKPGSKLPKVESRFDRLSARRA